jgi:hypothetical protein
MFQFNRKNGSAYLFVIGAISILTILVIFFLKANTSRRFSTRMMSDEKKAEALAESAVELAMGYIRENMNNPGSGDYYFPFRYPCELTTDGIGSDDAKNIPLDLTHYSAPFLEMEGSVSALEPVEYIIEELGGSDNVELKVSLSVPYAEAFSAKKDGYEVVGVSEKSIEPVGNSAMFLDSASSLSSGGSDGSLASINSDWKLDFKLPDHTYSDDHKVYIKGVPWPADVKKSIVTVTRLAPGGPSLEVLGTLDIKVEVLGVTVYRLKPSDPDGSMLVNVVETMREYVNLDDSAQNLTMEALRDQAMEGDADGSGLVWEASKFINEIRNEWDGLNSLIKGKINSDPYGSRPQVVEKGGVLQIKAEVKYWPNGKSGKMIEKNLIANRPFKVTDIQPPAPEYSFFVANSNLLFEGDDNPMGVSLGAPIDWSPTFSVASICVHNLPGGEYDNLSGLRGSTLDEGKKAQIPGMVRINSRQEMEINTFLGAASEPYLTEFNSLVNQKDITRFSILPTFRWNDSPAPNTQYEVHFPVIMDIPLADDWACTGFENLLSFLENCNAVAGPSQFFGKCFIEYPLGMSIEAAMKQKYGSGVFQVKPTGENGASPQDVSEIKITYTNKTKKYGIKGKDGYSSCSHWSPDAESCKPANVYSLLQYAKKATHFYASEEEFWADSERFPGGVYDCTGVTYVRGSLNINSEFKVKGTGILVVKDNIYATENVVRDDNDTIFTLMARAGLMHISGNCGLIEASCYSNVSPLIDRTEKFEINGNFVANEFVREDLDYLEIDYNSAAVRVSPLSVMRDVGKFDPKRYIVTVADNWSSYKFEKK